MPPKQSLMAAFSTEQLCQELEQRVQDKRQELADAEEQLQERRRQQEAELDKREQELLVREQQVQAEKEKLSGMLGKCEDVIEVNAGGQVHAVSRGTLCMVEGSLLASMFSGRWDDKMQRDSAGRPFLDVDPQIFEAILSYLRLQRVASPHEKTKGPEVEPRKEEALRAMMRYYGLEAAHVAASAASIAVTVTSLSNSSQGIWSAGSTDERPWGYLLSLQRPYKLNSVWVGCPGSPTGNSRIIVGRPPWTILLEVPIVPGTCPEDPAVTHVAGGLDIELQPPQCFIMFRRGEVNFRPGDRAVYTRGSFRVQAKFTDALTDWNNHPCMAIGGHDM